MLYQTASTACGIGMAMSLSTLSFTTFGVSYEAEGATGAALAVSALNVGWQTTATNTTQFTTAQAAATTYPLFIRGACKVNAGGSLQLMFRSETASLTVTMIAGSNMRFWRVA